MVSSLASRLEDSDLEVLTVDLGRTNNITQLICFFLKDLSEMGTAVSQYGTVDNRGNSVWSISYLPGQPAPMFEVRVRPGPLYPIIRDTLLAISPESRDYGDQVFFVMVP